MSKELEALERIKTKIIIETEIKVNRDLTIANPYHNDYLIIKQALLKAQEQEKENAELKRVLEVLKPNLRLVGNCLQARVPLVDEADLWVFVKEITNEEEFNLLKRYFK